ncbi:hypothetical protein GCM10008022_10480 [Paenibacillus hunanensis]|nr:hypothetical protein GCM10008022_10480 [Paenibacillus hunanensis]
MEEHDEYANSITWRFGLFLRYEYILEALALSMFGNIVHVGVLLDATATYELVTACAVSWLI